MQLIEQMKESGVVAIIRGANEDVIIPIAEALKTGGIKNIELTLGTPKVLNMIEMLATEYKDDFNVGVGTVLDAESARASIMAGAKFIISPTVDEETIRLTKRHGVLSMPGALTPTEILKAYEAGADIVKVFPSRSFGPKYISDLHGPLPHIPLMPTGGIGVNNIGDYLQAGAVAVGVGSTLVNTSLEMNQTNLTKITENARQLVKEVQKVR